MVGKGKTVDEYFRDWAREAFPFGYGTGEQYTLPALKQFLELCSDEGYDSEKVEGKLGHLGAWLMLDVLISADVLSYGTSPRYGWLTEKGKRLKNYVLEKSDEELYKIVLNLDDFSQEYQACEPNLCVCTPGGKDGTGRCPNPFWCD